MGLVRRYDLTTFGTPSVTVGGIDVETHSHGCSIVEIWALNILNSRFCLPYETGPGQEVKFHDNRSYARALRVVGGAYALKGPDWCPHQPWSAPSPQPSPSSLLHTAVGPGCTTQCFLHNLALAFGVSRFKLQAN